MQPLIFCPLSGAFVNLLAPTVESIHLCDMAHGLSGTNRYSAQFEFESAQGRVPRGSVAHELWGYSVAQHSLLVAQHLPRHLRLKGLLHDGPEYVAGDVPAPVKELLRASTEVYDRIEAGLAKVIDLRFGLVWSEADHFLVKQADLYVRHLEMAHHCPSHPRRIRTPLPAAGKAMGILPRRMVRQVFYSTILRTWQEDFAVGRVTVAPVPLTEGERL